MAWIVFRVEQDEYDEDLRVAILRRVDHNGVSTWLNKEIKHGIEIPRQIASDQVESYIRAKVRESGWVGNEIFSANSEVGKALLCGRW